jgi:nicotinate-nucleotide pyrophosphorylase (carboxylating)
MTAGEREFRQQTRDKFLRDSLEQLTRLAIREDLGRGYDLTTVSLVPAQLPAKADIRARVAGVAAGVELIEWMVDCMQATIELEIHVRDGQAFAAGERLATFRGSARDVLTCERTILNFLGRLCGIATWTAQHVACVADLPVRIYDTRKTTPGWRLLEKYATRCGGAWNHRSGLHDAILIKDNHLAAHARGSGGQVLRPSDAVRMARAFLQQQPDAPADALVEIEVDTLEQLADALTAAPDIILLDNMGPETLRQGVAMRNEGHRQVQLEASGGVNLESLRAVAESGVDRISLGALTHSAVNLDLGLDWQLG